MTTIKPKIKLLPVSWNELCNAQDQWDNFVTVVCLATGFYPDHVTIKWEVNGKERNNSVATDHVAQQDPVTRLYNMSSRLMVNQTEWTNVKNKFTCIVIFYNGHSDDKLKKTITYSPGTKCTKLP